MSQDPVVFLHIQQEQSIRLFIVCHTNLVLIKTIKVASLTGGRGTGISTTDIVKCVIKDVCMFIIQVYSNVGVVDTDTQHSSDQQQESQTETDVWSVKPYSLGVHYNQTL